MCAAWLSTLHTVKTIPFTIHEIAQVNVFTGLLRFFKFIGMISEELELRIYDDETGNLNFWDWAHGNDVIVDITPDGKLMKSEFVMDENGVIKDDENGDALKTEPVEITFQEYIALVKESVKKRCL